MLFDYRRLIEGEAARCAALNAKPQEVRELAEHAEASVLAAEQRRHPGLRGRRRPLPHRADPAAHNDFLEASGEIVQTQGDGQPAAVPRPEARLARGRGAPARADRRARPTTGTPRPPPPPRSRTPTRRPPSSSAGSVSACSGSGTRRGRPCEQHADRVGGVRAQRPARAAGLRLARRSALGRAGPGGRGARDHHGRRAQRPGEHLPRRDRGGHRRPPAAAGAGGPGRDGARVPVAPDVGARPDRGAAHLRPRARRHRPVGPGRQGDRPAAAPAAGLPPRVHPGVRLHGHPTARSRSSWTSRTSASPAASGPSSCTPGATPARTPPSPSGCGPTSGATST
jgi:hypothetical protein